MIAVEPILTDALPLTTRDSASAFVWQRQRALPARGIVTGIDHLAGRARFAYDAWTLYGEGIIRSPAMTILGQVGNGKSSLVKAFAGRQIVAGRQAFIFDPKSEYARFAASMDIPVIRLAPGGSVHVNPLDPGPLGVTSAKAYHDLHERRVGLITALFSAATRREPSQAEHNGIDVAINDAAVSEGDGLLLGHVVERLFEPTPQMAAALHSTRADLGAEVRDVALALRRLVDGDMKGMFDSATNIYPNFDGRGLVVDLSAVYNTDALGPVMAAASTWLMHAISATSRQRLLILDEAWALLGNA